MAGDAYGAWLKQDLGGVVETLGLSDLQTRFMHSRWLDQVIWLESKAKQSQRRYYALRLVTIVAGVLVPALVSLNINKDSVSAALGWATFAISLLVALAAALEEFFHYGDRWRHYRRTAEALKGQGWQFFELAGPSRAFTSHAEAFPAFAARVESLIQQDVQQYVTQVVEERPKQDGAGSS